MKFMFARVLTILAAAAPLGLSAATPAGGTLSPATAELTFTSGPHAVSNPSSDANGGVCGNPAPPCDHYALTVDLPGDYAITDPNATVRIVASWPNTAEDFDFYLLNPNGSVADSGATSADPEIMEVPAGSGMQSYRIRVVPFAVAGGTATVKITLVSPPPPPPDADGDGVTDANDMCPGTPPGSAVGSDGCVIQGPPSPQCDLPGPEILTDADNDHTGTNQAFDIRSMSIAEQNFSDGKKLYFTLKVDSLAQFPTSSARWIVPFTGADGKFYFLRMTKFADSSTPTFEYGTTASASTTTTTGPGCFSPGTGQVRAALDPASNFKPDGTITLVVNAANLGGLQDGQTLTGITARAQTLDGTSLVCGAGANNDTASAPAPYTVANSCPLIQAQPQLLPSGPPPRFYDFQSPETLADGAGEPTLGYNPKTKNAMFIAGVEVDRVVFAEHSAKRDAAGNPLPEACEAEWIDKSYDGAVNTLDPILETEQTTGRTFQSSLSGANSIFAFSDNDGDTWIPGQAGPPNGGVDHQTVGVGPWAPGAKPPSATVNYAVYYCSQSIVAAFCSRSDNGGLTFGPGINFRDTATDCNNAIGGLHGHVQVSRKDGTVYVPFGNCNNKAAVAVSTDSGLTWSVKKVPQSTGGDDPGLGIANDGSAYMCYNAGDGGKVFATVSRNRGDTWTENYDLGAALGIKHAVFATAVAGDGDRAACAFLGTTTAGNPEALDFPGIWYPYVSTTYDGGKSWHTVNLSPGDPVQGAGGICLSGTTCGSNRNLLDFNDIIMDDQGRVLFGYSDGCRGACVQNPAQNTFSDNGVIARQSGGRTLLAAFDDVTGTQFNSSAATTPAAACARADKSSRTEIETRVAWSPPDNGGSPVLNYKVFRSLAATGPFDFIGDAGPKTSFLDPTADGTVEKYYYKVVAENVQGAAPDSNVIELGITVPVNEDSCTLPGVTAVPDASGDSTGGAPQTDIQRVSFAELPASEDNLTITYKVGNLNPVPPNAYYFVLTKKKNGTNLFLSMDSENGIVTFRHGTYTAGTAGLLTFANQGTLPGSSFEANGNIRLVVPRSLFGDLQPGDVISPLDIRTRQGDESLPSRDTAGPGDYMVRGVRVCLPNTPPVAVLTATPQSGTPPLTVTFDGTGSFDNDTGVPDTIKTYVITFGDGTGASASDGETPVWQHTYAAPGVYSARLRVTDSRGLTSENSAQKVIEVLGGRSSPGTAEAGNNRLGGGLPAGTVLVLGLLGLLRLASRRRI